MIFLITRKELVACFIPVDGSNVAKGQVLGASDHDFNTEHLIPSETHRMNITSDTGDYIYSGGEEF